jgi:hypothetical protein
VATVTDTEILDWQADFRTQDTNRPEDAENIQATLDDEFRNIKSVVKAWSEDKSWIQIFGADQAFYSGTTLTSLNGAGINIPGADYTAIFERLRPVRFVVSGVTYYAVVLQSVYSSSGDVTRVSLSPLPIQISGITWTSLTGNDLAGTPTADINTIFGESQLNSGRQLLWVHHNDVISVCKVDEADSPGSGIIGIGDLVAQGLLTSHTDIEDAWYSDINVNGAFRQLINVTEAPLTSLAVGAPLSSLTKSQLPALYQSGSARVTGTASAGPYSLSALPRAEINNTYQVALQVTGTSIVTPSDDQLTVRVPTKTTTNFSVTFAASIPNGDTVDLDYLIHR